LLKVFDSYAWGDTSRRASVEDGQREEVVDRLCWTELLDTSFPSLVPNFRAWGPWLVGLSIPPARSANGLHLGRLYEESDPGRVRQGV